MARIRSIKPEYATSEAIASLSLGCELHFAKLWTYCDDYGRGLDNPRLIKAAIWPLRDEVSSQQVEEWQDELEKHGRIERYIWNGKALFEVVNWSEHQKPQHPKESAYPSFDSQEVIRKPHENFTKPTEDEVTVVVEGEGDVIGEGEVDGGLLNGAGDDFPEFWETYPRHHTTGKPGGGATKSEARKRWDKLKPTERESCLVAVRNYAQAISLPDAPYPKHATTWLNEKAWQDWLEPAPVHLARGPTQPKDRNLERVERLLGNGVTDGSDNGFADTARRGLPAGERP